MYTSGYPLRAGSKTDGASALAGRIVDRDPERKLNVQVEIALETLVRGGRCIDEISIELRESILYTRPRASELTSMGIIRKAGLKVSPTCGRSAHILEPAPDLADACRRIDQIDSADDLRIIIRGLIVARLADVARVTRQNRGLSSR